MSSSTPKPNSSKLRILFVTAGDKNKASSRVRAYWIAEELNVLGHHCTILPQYRRADLVELFTSIPKHDVIVFQKTYGRYHCWLQLFTRMLGKQTYVDIDDAPSIKNEKHTLRRVAKMMRRATGVFAGSNSLVEYSTQYQSDTHLIPSAIKLKNYPLKTTNDHSDQSICLGWIGNGNYYADDLIKILTEPLSKLAANHSIGLKIVGVCGNRKLHNAFVDIPNLKVNCIDQIDWGKPEVVAEQIHSFDIGLYPLLETRFNKFKCGFKALEYMACGLPVVSSKIAANESIITHEHNGFFAEDSNEWINYLEKLICDADLRLSTGKNGRATAEQNYNTIHVSQKISNLIWNNYS